VWVFQRVSVCLCVCTGVQGQRVKKCVVCVGCAGMLYVCQGNSEC